jgi:hypothetical protein
MVSRIFGDALDTATWFSADQQFAWGIHYILTGPHMTYQGYFPGYRRAYYSYFTNRFTGTIADDWRDIHLMYRCFFEPKRVLANYAPGTPVNFGNTEANLYYWIHAMNTLGEINTNLYADHPSLLVMTAGDTDRYIGFNFSDGPITTRLYHSANDSPAGFIIITNQGSFAVSSVDDTDGDGMTNGQELFTGTDLHDPKSFFRLDAENQRDGANLSLSWPAVSGRHYRVRSYPNISNLNHGLDGRNVLSGITGSGTVTQSVAVSAENESYFLLIAE